MKKVIGRKIYDTQTATELTFFWNGHSNGDFNYVCENLFVTKNGNYFLEVKGGANTDYGVDHGNGRGYGHSLIALSKDETLNWLIQHGETKLIEELFSEKIEEA